MKKLPEEWRNFFNFGKQKKHVTEKIHFDDLGLALVFDLIPLGMILLDQNAKIISTNKAFENTFGLNGKSVVGKQLFENKVFIVDKEQLMLLLQKLKTSQLSKGLTLLITNNKKTSHLFEFNIIFTKNRIPIYAAIAKEGVAAAQIKEELVKQLELKEGIENQLGQESELSEMKSRFLSIASHEFRTPLAGILSSLNLIERYLLVDKDIWLKFKNRNKIENHINKINESVKSLTTLINKFLALGNIEKGEIPVRPSNLNLPNTINTQISHFTQIAKPGQKLLYEHLGQKKTVFLDKLLFKNIINNLISNAIKFSPEDSAINITTDIDQKEFKLTVKDMGIGIPQAEQNKIFSRFYRAKNALNYQEGTGLGLNIVKNYVELMDGKITFESTENTGTKFIITFPKNEK